MGKLPGQLGTKLETGRCFLYPACDGFTVRGCIKGGVSLNRGQALTVQTQKINGAAMERKKLSHPTFEGPHGAAEKERAIDSVWHASQRGEQEFNQAKNRSYLPDPEEEHPFD